MCKQIIVRYYDCNHIATSDLKHCAELCGDESGATYPASQCPYAFITETQYINKPTDEAFQVCDLCESLPNTAKMGPGVGVWLRAAAMVQGGIENSGFTANRYGEIQDFGTEDCYLVGGMIPGKDKVNYWPEIRGRSVQEVARLIADFCRRYQAELREPNTYVGGWVDAEGALFLDVSNRAEDRVKAQLLSIFREEIALYAVHSRKVIRNTELEEKIRVMIALMDEAERLRLDGVRVEDLHGIKEEAHNNVKTALGHKRRRGLAQLKQVTKCTTRCHSVKGGARSRRRKVAFICHCRLNEKNNIRL